MKIKCICLDDKNRPSEIPVEKWVKENEIYHITWIFKQLNQPGIKGVELAEFDISSCEPYNCYRLSRFGISVDDLERFKALCQDSNNINKIEVSSFVEKLIEEGNLILQD